MAFEVGDEVAYDGPLGQHRGSVAAVQADGAVDVRIDGLPELVRTDEGSLFGRYAAGGPIAPGAVIETGQLVPPFATGGIVSPVGTLPSDAVPAFLDTHAAPGFAHDDLATPAATQPQTEA